MARGSRTNSDPRRPLNDAELAAYAVSYLSRFDCTAVKLRQVLARKLAKHSSEHGAAAEGDRVTDGSPPDIERIIARFVELGYLNDARFAQSLAQGLLARGTAPNVRAPESTAAPAAGNQGQLSDEDAAFLSLVGDNPLFR